jgi:hypothetical protein
MDRLARHTAHRLVRLVILTLAAAPRRASGTIADAVANVLSNILPQTRPPLDFRARSDLSVLGSLEVS